MFFATLFMDFPSFTKDPIAEYLSLHSQYPHTRVQTGPLHAEQFRGVFHLAPRFLENVADIATLHFLERRCVGKRMICRCPDLGREEGAV